MCVKWNEKVYKIKYPGFVWWNINYRMFTKLLFFGNDHSMKGQHIHRKLLDKGPLKCQFQFQNNNGADWESLKIEHVLG